MQLFKYLPYKNVITIFKSHVFHKQTQQLTWEQRLGLGATWGHPPACRCLEPRTPISADVPRPHMSLYTVPPTAVSNIQDMHLTTMTNISRTVYAWRMGSGPLDALSLTTKAKRVWVCNWFNWFRIASSVWLLRTRESGPRLAGNLLTSWTTCSSMEL
jgi:hypothetical protein